MPTPNLPTPPDPVGPPDAAASGARMRLARLRPEFASRYPGLDAGSWYPAASVAAYFRSWLLRHPGPGQSGDPMRGLDTAHFEFRGGAPREPPWFPGHSLDQRQSPDGE
jgi:hypothetical protein